MFLKTTHKHLIYCIIFPFLAHTVHSEQNKFQKIRRTCVQGYKLSWKRFHSYHCTGLWPNSPAPLMDDWKVTDDSSVNFHDVFFFIFWQIIAKNEEKHFMEIYGWVVLNFPVVRKWSRWIRPMPLASFITRSFLVFRSWATRKDLVI